MLIKCFALVELRSVLRIERHQWIADVEVVFDGKESPFERQFGKKSVCDVECIGASFALVAKDIAGAQGKGVERGELREVDTYEWLSSDVVAHAVVGIEATCKVVELGIATSKKPLVVVLASEQ